MLGMSCSSGAALASARLSDPGYFSLGCIRIFGKFGVFAKTRREAGLQRAIG
jgi:hypothetical protein